MSREKLVGLVAAKSKQDILEIEDTQELKNNLGLDSVALIELSVEVYNEFDVDLSEAFEQGNPLVTFGDLMKAIKV